jgi:signal peptidase
MAESTDGAATPPTAPAGRRELAIFAVKLVFSALVMAGVTTMLSLFIWTVLPFVVGWSPSVVVTGSMAPQIMPGDIVVAAPIKPQTLQIGYVVRFHDPAHVHPFVMHRIVKMNDDGTLVTRGDANQSEDSTPVPRENVVGVARLRVPMIGLPAVWLRNGNYLQLGLTLIAVLIAARVLSGLRALIANAPIGQLDDEPGGPADWSFDPDIRLKGRVIFSGMPSRPPVPEPVWATSPFADQTVVIGAIAGENPVGERSENLATQHAGPVLQDAGPVLQDAGPGSQDAGPVDQGAERPPAGRHRGEGRASWRRTGASGRRRSQDRERVGTPVG